jgi:hypothetical protein
MCKVQSPGKGRDLAWKMDLWLSGQPACLTAKDADLLFALVGHRLAIKGTDTIPELLA